jgi:hypothetical protein
MNRIRTALTASVIALAPVVVLVATAAGYRFP